MKRHTEHDVRLLATSLGYGSTYNIKPIMNTIELATSDDNHRLKELEFFIDIDPEGAKRPRKGRTVFYDPSAGFKKSVKKIVMSQLPPEFTPIEGEISMTMEVFVKRPSYMEKKKNHILWILGLVKVITRPDIDNYAKNIMDAFNKDVYKDDGQIYELIARKLYSDKPGFLVKLTYRDKPLV